MTSAVTVRPHLPETIEPPFDVDAAAKKALDDIARSIGRSAVNHLKEMYPDALAAVTKNAEVSLTNHVRNNINLHMRPLLAKLIEFARREANVNL